MSVHTSVASSVTGKPITTADIMAAKGKRKLTMLTAYDFSIATLVNQSAIDMLLVGDSLGMVMLGRKDTVSVTLDEMIHHCRAVMQAAGPSLVIGDMPFMTYESSVAEALRNATRMCQESGIRAVKLEGGRNIVPQIKALVAAGIPVCGHIGLTPQRAAVLGGFKVQGKTAKNAYTLIEDALALQDAGCFCMVLEAVPAAVAKRLSEKVTVPIIGIGAGADCDGQVLVYHDMLGLYSEFVPKFAKQYVQAGEIIKKAFMQYAEEVKNGVFPAPEHTFSIKDDELTELDKLLKNLK